MDAQTSLPIVLHEGFNKTVEALIADVDFLEIEDEEASDEDSESETAPVEDQLCFDPAKAENRTARGALAVMACLQLLGQDDPELQGYDEFGVTVDLDYATAMSAGNDTFENDEVWDPIDLSLDLQMLENTPFHRSNVLRLGRLLYEYEKLARSLWNMISPRLQRRDNKPNPQYYLMRAAVRAKVETQARQTVRAIFKVVNKTVAPGVRLRQEQLQVLQDFSIGGLFPNQGEIELLAAFTRVRAGTIEAYFEALREEQMPILRILDIYDRGFTVQVAEELFRLVKNYLADH